MGPHQDNGLTKDPKYDLILSGRVLIGSELCDLRCLSRAAGLAAGDVPDDQDEVIGRWVGHCRSSQLQVGRLPIRRRRHFSASVTLVDAHGSPSPWSANC